MNGKAGLHFRRDGTFTIVQFTDIHWQDGDLPDRQSHELMCRILDEERPDLVVYTGDTIYASDFEAGTPRPVQALREALSATIDRRIPWAYVLGNHDSERKILRSDLIDAAAAMPYSLCERGPADIGGSGNYVLEIAPSGGGTGVPAAVLYMLDSGDYSGIAHVPGYDWIRRGQVDWYVRRSAEYTARNGGTPLPALAFFHIPFPEYLEVWERGVCYGEKQEKVCAPSLNSGLFAAMVEMGDVTGTVVGHDHVNDFWGELHGVRLIYGRQTGYNTYGWDNRGARVIRLTEGRRDFVSWMRLADGTVVPDSGQPRHEPEFPVNV